MIQKKNLEDKKIIFFDGYCGLCNFFVTTVIKLDKKRMFRYAPLQGELAKELLRAELIT